MENQKSIKNNKDRNSVCEYVRGEKERVWIEESTDKAYMNRTAIQNQAMLTKHAYHL